ncbi:hypothetical protein [Pseudaminobacter salicylatoxidans]|uniref:hypothetical protein n=1 Tax=Pseudaminobacter salicylatoxidans TaxID=93369 RepID=UPI000D6B1691|nr:hypothetical protein [Pseudaminobacter salicylatoxidans]
MTEALDKIYTAAEAAERLRLTNRALIKIARKSGHCSRAGRDYLFSESDLLAIWQDMREPAVERRTTSGITPLPRLHGVTESLKWLSYRPPTKVDRRVLEVLRWLERQKEPKSYAEIERCGPRTIDDLLQKGLVTQCGTDDDGLANVMITPRGKDELRTYDRWNRKRGEREGRRR